MVLAAEDLCLTLLKLGRPSNRVNGYPLDSRLNPTVVQDLIPVQTDLVPRESVLKDSVLPHRRFS
jgi:hypothetical protein